MPQRKDGDLRTISQVQLLKNGREIVLDGLLRIGQLLRNLLVAHAHGDITYNLYFFWLQRLDILAWGSFGYAPILFDDHIRHRWCHKYATRMHHSDSFGNFTRRCRLE